MTFIYIYILIHHKLIGLLMPMHPSDRLAVVHHCPILLVSPNLQSSSLQLSARWRKGNSLVTALTGLDRLQLGLGWISMSTSNICMILLYFVQCHPYEPVMLARLLIRSTWLFSDKCDYMCH